MRLNGGVVAVAVAVAVMMPLCGDEDNIPPPKQPECDEKREIIGAAAAAAALDRVRLWMMDDSMTTTLDIGYH